MAKKKPIKIKVDRTCAVDDYPYPEWLLEEERVRLRRDTIRRRKRGILPQIRLKDMPRREDYEDVVVFTREYNRLKMRQWRKKNHEKVLENKRQYREKNKEKLNAQDRTRRSNISDEARVKQNIRRRKYRANNAEKVLLSKRLWRERNKDKVNSDARIWHEKNKESFREWNKKYCAERRKSNVQYRLSCALHSRLAKALRGNSRKGHMIDLLGCTILEFKEYISKQFIGDNAWMAWENWGPKTWHIDHIRPCYEFDHTDPEQVKICWHHTNMRPLAAKANLSRPRLRSKTPNAKAA
jgi:hypothetical protein